MQYNRHLIYFEDDTHFVVMGITRGATPVYFKDPLSKFWITRFYEADDEDEPSDIQISIAGITNSVLIADMINGTGYMNSNPRIKVYRQELQSSYSTRRCRMVSCARPCRRTRRHGIRRTVSIYSTVYRLL